MEVYKGDIFYIEKGKTGEKLPAVVVSATEAIEETGCAQVAWLTNKEENSSPTHVKVMCMTPSVAICENCHSPISTGLENISERAQKKKCRI